MRMCEDVRGFPGVDVMGAGGVGRGGWGWRGGLEWGVYRGRGTEELARFSMVFWF